MQKQCNYKFLLLITLILSFSTYISADELKGKNGSKINIETPLVYINTLFNNGSPLFWRIESDGKIHIELMYDHERNALNRANSHWHFQLFARAGSDLTLVLKNFYNIWNGRVDLTDASDETVCFFSENGKDWSVAPTTFLEGQKLEVQIHMTSDSLYVARLEPYTVEDLEDLKFEILTHPLVKITEIGKTVEGRDLEIIRVGHVNAPNRVFIRARSHAWEAGGNWVVQGLIRSLIKNVSESSKYLERYAVYIMPMANKDRVANGGTRFNMSGENLNRKWDKPANPKYNPENACLEKWLQKMIDRGLKPDLAIDFHNDANGRIHISRPNIDLDKYLDNMKQFEQLLRKHTWFTEGSTGGEFRNPGTLGEGFVERFGIDAFIYELNANWIAGLSKVPMGRDWELLGEQLRDVFYDYFNTMN
jgi:hypothetical protein